MAEESNGLNKWLSPYVYLSSNWVSRVGVVMATTGAILWFILLPVILRGFNGAPYAGILTFIGLPAIFFGGLILIPIGILLRRRHEHQKGIYPANFPPLNWRNPHLRYLLLFVGVTTMANVIIGSQLVYSGIHYTDSVTFCGQTCHTVMQPEYVAYLHSPHARVACVECHIGPGASWFVRYKLSGLYQVYATVFDTYPRPIPVPVTNLRPARATCEQCHWPARFEGNRLVIIPQYAADKTNTFTQTVLLMHIGGGNGRGGIHGAHVGPGIIIRYGSDPSRQKMYWVEYNNTRTGKKTLFVGPSTNPKTVNPATGRVMDCVDCHNMPTHIFYPPGRAIDDAMAQGIISPSLPFVKKEGLTLLETKYTSQRQAAQKISAGLWQFYRQKYPDAFPRQRQQISQAVKGLVSIYDDNVFPAMHVTWGTYPNNIGHTHFPGCFRCHGTLHDASDPAKLVPIDCNVCHDILAVGEAHPKILTELGLNGTPQGTGN